MKKVKGIKDINGMINRETINNVVKRMTESTEYNQNYVKYIHRILFFH
jgi:hypothetical protein